MLRAFLFADPAAHSLSPAMHGAAFAYAGLSGTYEARRVPPAELGPALAGLRVPDVIGANLSLPHKEAAVPLLDDLSDAARAIGAVNTIVHRGGRLLGDNTDAPGFLAALGDEGADVALSDRTAVVLGAGGAARAAVYALLRAECRVWVWNRTPERAERLAADMSRPEWEFQARAADFASIPWHEADLVVNASSAGLNAPEESPLPAFPALAPHAFVYDMVYKPAETRLLRDARERGHGGANGLSMLAHQARLAFLAWTGQDVPARVFLDAARSFMDGGALTRRR